MKGTCNAFHFYGDMPEAVYNPVIYFKNTYTDEWITDKLSREMIRDVDRSEVIGPRVIDSPVLGGISARELSGGVKTLIAIYKCRKRYLTRLHAAITAPSGP